MRLLVLLSTAALGACSFSNGPCAPNCRYDQVVVDAAVPATLPPAQEPDFCESVCPTGYNYGWLCDGVDGGVRCDPKCPC